jgi:hypothetical protein
MMAAQLSRSLFLLLLFCAAFSDAQSKRIIIIFERSFTSSQ